MLLVGSSQVLTMAESGLGVVEEGCVRVRAGRIVEVSAGQFYGEGYQDMQTRTPSILQIQRCLGWTPTVDLKEALTRTLDAFLEENLPS